MEDRLKFRYWDKQINKMRTGDILMGSNGIPYIIGMDTGKPIVQEIEDVEVMQCTGLKDKKENLLFEQDIVKGDEGEIGIINWDKPTARYIIYFYKDDYIIDFDDYRAVGIEKIGNAYENPELLKGGQE